MLAAVGCLLLLSSAVAAQPEDAAGLAPKPSVKAADLPPFDPPDNPFERGAYPLEDPWLSDMIGLRRAHGFDASFKVVSELMQSTAAQTQVATYGVLLTESEEADYEYLRNVQEALDRVMATVEDHPGFAGVIVHPDSRPFEAEILVTDQHREDVGSLIGEALDNERGDRPLVRFTIVDFSLKELHAAASSLRLRLGVDPTEKSEERAGKITPEKSDAALAVISKRPELEGTNVGYSTRNNTLVLHLPVGREAPEETISLGLEYPVAVVLASKSQENDHAGHDGDSPDDQPYSDGCGRWWCGAAKAGVQTEFENSSGASNNCSTSPAIQVKINSSSAWVTKHVSAGHCGTPSTETWYRNALQGSSSTLSTHFGIVKRADSTTKIGTEWRNSIYRAGAAWGDFQLISGSEKLTANNLMLTSSTSSARVTSISNVNVGSDVCISVNHVDPPLCDEVEDIGHSIVVEGKSVVHLATTRGSYEAEKGDSGGPLYRQGSPHIFVGVHQGEWSNWLEQTWQVFSRASLIDNSNMNLYYTTQPVPSNGVRDFIQGLYARNLNRTPDIGGYNNWLAEMTPCNQVNAADVAKSFLVSVEFAQNRFPINTSNAATNDANAKLRIWYAYQTYFGRSPDQVGFNYWYGQLATAIAQGGANGGIMWLNILDWWGFSTPEFANRVSGVGVFPPDGFICA